MILFGITDIDIEHINKRNLFLLTICVYHGRSLRRNMGGGKRGHPQYFTNQKIKMLKTTTDKSKANNRLMAKWILEIKDIGGLLIVFNLI